MKVDAAANDIVRKAIRQAVDSGREIGVQVAAYHRGRLVIDAWGGLADETTGREVDGDTLFNAFSVAKAVTATALHLQVDRGLVDYDAPIARYWPEFAAHGKDRVTVRDALTHRAGLPQMPAGVTPELMADWGWMTREIAALEPVAPPGETALYQAMTFGWIIGQIVVRTDPKSRTIGAFIREEIAGPLNAPDLWIGAPDAVAPRMAKLTYAIEPIPAEFLPPLLTAAMPAAVALEPSIFALPVVRRAELAGVGGIFTARSCARFFAMLANGGELDGVRLISRELVKTFGVPRTNAEQPDRVMFDTPLPITIGGFWYGGGRDRPLVRQMHSPRAFGHPGAGGAIGWADPDENLAVALNHNRMYMPSSADDDSLYHVALAIRQALGLSL